MSVFRCACGISDGNMYCKKKMNRLGEILLWVWQFPQNIIGLIFRLCFGWHSVPYNGVDVIFDNRFPGSLSLGRTVIVKYPYWVKPDTWKHEFGHCRQSQILGPFYLIVIGIPSLLWACWYRKHKRGSYYAFYTEKWADSLGGVKRTNL